MVPPWQTYPGVPVNPWGSPYAYPNIHAENAPVTEDEDSSATSNAIHSVVEGSQHAMNGVLAYMTHERASADRARRQHTTQHNQVVNFTQSLLSTLPELVATQYNLEQTVRQLLARGPGNPNPLDTTNITPNTDLKQRQLDTLFHDLEGSVIAVRRVAEGLATCVNVKVPPIVSRRSVATLPRAYAVASDAERAGADDDPADVGSNARDGWPIRELQ